MNWLAELREKAGIKTQAELAARLQLQGFNYSPGAISHWENDARNPPLDNEQFRKALAFILRVSEKELLKKAGYDVDIHHSQAAERAAYIIDQLPEDKQQLALNVLEQFLAG